MKVKTAWCCKECGHTSAKWLGMCPHCKEWNTFAEFKEAKDKKEASFTAVEQRPTALPDLTFETMEKIETSVEEFDRLLGGGFVPGSLTLLSGDPGIGKSTLTLQICAGLASRGKKVLYVSGEESLQQISLRAKRLKVSSQNIYLYHETSLEKIFRQIEELRPDFVVLDSIQVLYKNTIEALPGSVAQIREVAFDCMRLAKSLGTILLMIGHITKGGDFAGPKILEHIVDTSLDFDADHERGFRILRAVKHRFGSTEPIAIFQMKGEGLCTVENPSQILLQDRQLQVPGAVVVPAMEGNRPILVEVQALVAQSAYPSSIRRSTGMDANRLSLLLAVLEKRMNYRLYQSDIFVSVAGGWKISEPALDLGVILAIASSFSSRHLDPATLAIGEVGLSGEVRQVSRVEIRLQEALQMGFTRCILPRSSLRSIPKGLHNQIELIPVEVVDEAVRELARATANCN